MKIYVFAYLITLCNANRHRRTKSGKDCPRRCSDLSICETYLDCSEGICRSRCDVGDPCSLDDNCFGDLVCVNETCVVESDESGGGELNPSSATDGTIPAGEDCQPGQMCEGGVECPSCFVEPCTCPEIVEAAVF